MRRRQSTNPGMLYTIAGVLIVASSQSIKEASNTAYYIMMGVGILACALGLIKLLRSNNG